MNLPPLSWTTHAGLGYQANQVFSNFLAMASLELVSMRVSSTRLVVVSMHVKAYNSPLNWSVFTVQGPIRLMATSYHGALVRLHSGNSPILLRGILTCSVEVVDIFLDVWVIILVS